MRYISPLRILFVLPVPTDSPDGGGVTTYTIRTAGELAHRGYTVTILCPGDTAETNKNGVCIIHRLSHSPKAERWRDRNFPLLTLRFNWMRTVLRFFDETGPYDIVETPEWGSGALGISLMRRTPVIVRLHRSLYQYYRDNALPIGLDISCIRILEAVSILLAKGVTSPTFYMLTTHRFIFLLRRIFRSPASVIPNGILPKSAVRSRRRDHLFLLTVGRIETAKGAMPLVRAFVRIAREIPQLRLVFVGADTLMREENGWISTRENIGRLLTRERLIERVAILPHIPTVLLASLYAGCLCYVQPSIGTENQPYALLDAVGFGKAIIASRAGGLPELVRHNRNGLLVTPGDTVALAKALLRIVKDAKFRKRCEAYNTRYAKRFSVQVTVDKTIAFYETLL